MSSDSLSASVEDITSEDAEAEGEIFYLECEETSGYLIFNKEVCNELQPQKLLYSFS